MIHTYIFFAAKADCAFGGTCAVEWIAVLNPNSYDIFQKYNVH